MWKNVPNIPITACANASLSEVPPSMQCELHPTNTRMIRNTYRREPAHRQDDPSLCKNRTNFRHNPKIIVLSYICTLRQRLGLLPELPNRAGLGSVACCASFTSCPFGSGKTSNSQVFLSFSFVCLKVEASTHVTSIR